VTTGFVVKPKNPLALQPNVQVKAVAAKGHGDAIVIDLKFRGESPVYVDAWKDGKPISFGKSALISWKIETVSGEQRVFLRMAAAYAKKRGFITGQTLK